MMKLNQIFILEKNLCDIPLVQNVFDGMSNRKCPRWDEYLRAATVLGLNVFRLLKSSKVFYLFISKTETRYTRCTAGFWIHFIANVISASQATSPFTVAIPFPFPTGPFIRIISTSN